MHAINNNQCRYANLLIWDSDDEPPTGDWTTLLWRGLESNGQKDVISIPALVEEQAEVLRARFLAWIYEVGESLINNKRLIDHLELRSGLSYWWMLPFVEGNEVYSAKFYDVIRLFAMEALLQKSCVSQITLLSHDKKLIAIVKDFCQQKAISFIASKSKSRTAQIPFIRSFFLVLPFPIQALINLARGLPKRWSFKKKDRITGIANQAEITFVDCLIHLNKDTFTKHRFVSNYWSSLITLLSENKISTNWFHHYYEHEAVPNRQRAKELMAKFNKNSEGLETHACLDELISFDLVLKALRDYCFLLMKSIYLFKVKHCFRSKDTSLNLWSIFKTDWLKLLRGPVAMSNCFMINLIEKMVSQLPTQKMGFYLLENLPWEMALIHAWQACGHGRLIGVQHTTVRYWNLSYFYDPRCYIHRGRNSLPLPDLVAINGPMAMKAYLQGGYPSHLVQEVEALRYLYLEHAITLRNPKSVNPSRKRILVCGDFSAAATHQMMQWLVIASSYLPYPVKYTVKPHPCAMIFAENYPTLAIKVTDDPLAILLQDCDVVFTSNGTSAVIDAYSLGLPVIQVLNGDAFNISPLRGLSGVNYVSNPQELVAVFFGQQSSQSCEPESFFYLDRHLPRWQNLLNVCKHTPQC